jgi:hypothetical protein
MNNNLEGDIMREYVNYQVENNRAVLSLLDFVKIFKNYLIDELFIDLDELNVWTTIKIIDNRLYLTLNIDELIEESYSKYVLLIRDLEKHFGPQFFVVGHSINTNLLLSKIFDSCSYFAITKDSIDIYL